MFKLFQGFHLLEELQHSKTLKRVSKKYRLKTLITLSIACIAFFGVWFAPPEILRLGDISVIEQRVVAIFVLAVLMWVMEVVPAWCTTGFFSMFISNTATAAMMLAFLTPVLKALPKDGKGRIAMALAIPLAANIGGIGTPISTPPNALAHATGLVAQKDMVKTGLVVGVIGLVLGYALLVILGVWGLF